MSAKINSISFFLSKYIFSYNLYIFFLFFIGNINIVINENALEVNAPYPVCLQLQNQKLVLANQKGIYFCTENLEIQNQFHYSLYDFSTLVDKVYIIELENDGYAVCLIDLIFYFISPGGAIEITGRLPNEGSDYSFLNLISYKKEGGTFYFIASLIDKDVSIIHHYYYKVDQQGFRIEYNKTYTPHYTEYPNIKLNYKYFTCQIMFHQNTNKNLLTCCFGTAHNDLIVIQSFDIENQFNELGEIYARIENEYLNMITSSICDDKTNLLVCYSIRNLSVYCFQYNIDSNEIANNKLYVSECSPKYTMYKSYYFKETKEFVFICQNNEEFILTKFSQSLDFLSSETFKLNNYSEFSSLSLIYNKNEGGFYEMISDPKSGSSAKMTKKFSLKNLQPQNQIIPPWIYTKFHEIMITSNDSIPFIIDFCDENNLLAKTAENKSIDISLYSLKLESANWKGNIIANISGQEKIIENAQLLPNVCKVKYYKEETQESLDSGYNFVFTYSFTTLNNDIASNGANYDILVCKPNCTCDKSNFCKSCLEDYFYYGYSRTNCIHKDDLENKVYNENEGAFFDCYYKCRTCSFLGYDDYSMGCSSCYEEKNYYFKDGGCYEIICDNLFYRDKNTHLKTCINLTECPEEYPIFDSSTKECKIIPETELSTYSESISLYEINKANEQNSEEIKKSDLSEILPSISLTSKVDKKSNQEVILNLLKDELGESNLDDVNKIYKALSKFIQNGNITSFDEDIIIKGENITYQFTTTENQKNAKHSNNISVIDLGECEKIIKKNISSENDATPLLILKIDIKKEQTKTTAVEYEVYDPKTKKVIDLSICENESISIYAPVSLNQQEKSLYNDLNKQGYDLYEVNNSFYIDPCTQYTSQNGTDVQLSDRKDYFYNENIVLCEDNCKYIKVYTQVEKVYCNCSIKSSVNTNGNQEFSPQKLLESFYKIEAISNFEVLYCYKLVFSSKGLKTNICFYILLVLFVLFLVSMIINLFMALKKIDEIIFKIFQDKFMFYFFQRIIMNGRQRRNAKINIDLINNNDNKDKKDEKNGKTKLSWLERLKLASKTKKPNGPSSILGESAIKDDDKDNENINIIKKKSSKKNVRNSILIDNIEEKDDKKGKFSKKKRKNSINKKYSNTDIEDDIIKSENDNKEQKENNDGKRYHHRDTKVHKSKSSHHKSKSSNYKSKVELNDSNNKKKEDIFTGKGMGNININIINNILSHHKHNPPIKKQKLIIKEQTKEKELEESSQIKKKKKKKNKNRKKVNNKTKNETPKSISSYISSFANLKRSNNNKLKRTTLNLNEKKEEKKNEQKKPDSKQPINKKEEYVDEELNTMDYKMALQQDKRNYWQYYWSLLKKKHMIILTFVSNDDYNVFLLKFSLFILSLALFFGINTLFYNDNSMHNIFSEQGRYNLLYQIPQTLYSTLISSVTTFILKKLSLSQSELIDIKKEKNQNKSKKMADKSKKCLKIKLYSFFFFGLILLLFCWYYISAFAAVYINTQIHLIKDTLLSFGISISYPFLINFIPAIFRMQSLKTHDRECLFKTGQIISLI